MQDEAKKNCRNFVSTATRTKPRKATPSLPDTDPDNPTSIIDLIDNLPQMLTAAQLALLLSLSPKTIYSMVDDGRIPHTRIGAAIRFCPHTVADWLNEKSVA